MIVNQQGAPAGSPQAPSGPNRRYRITLSIGGVCEAPSKAEAMGYAIAATETLEQAIPELIGFEISAHVMQAAE